MQNTNGHTLLIGTSEALYKAESTKDGYATRKLGLEGRGDMRAAAVVDRNDPLTFYAGTIKGGMFRSRDGGETWASINEGLLYKTVWSITQHRETGDLYVGASPASVFVSRDQGDRWTECESLELMKETKEWKGPVPPYISRMKSLAVVGSTPAIFGAIEEGWAVRSLDGGKTWEQIAAHIGMLAHDGHSIVVGGDGLDMVVMATGKGMFRSTDRGDHFAPVNEGLEKRSYTSSALASHPDRPGFLLSGVTAVGPGRWRRPEGGDSGIARSEDGGRTWQVSTRGLPSPCVGVPRGLGIAPDDTSLCVAGFTDGTVWASRDSGQSFERLLDGLPPVTSLAVV